MQMPYMNGRLTEEDLKRSIPDERLRNDIARLLGQMDQDDSAMVVLKGHLVIEEKLDSIIDKFVWHPEQLEAARLSFAQRVAIARAVSVDQDKNDMWDLILKVNTLRNKLSHSLDRAPRERAMAAIREVYIKAIDLEPSDLQNDIEALFLMKTMVGCLGFLGALEREVERFRDYVDIMDKVVNSHRHANFSQDESVQAATEPSDTQPRPDV
jgi:hypothetical protein